MNRRQLQVNSLLQQELSNYWEKEIELPKNTILSVSRVEVTSSFDQAFVYISVWPVEKQEEILFDLKHNIYQTQKFIDKRLSMRKVPKLVLRVDEQSSSRREVEDILDSLSD